VTDTRVELLASPAWPNAATTKKTVIDCMTALGIDVAVVERVGHYRSPTGDACRLDLPTPQSILNALRRDDRNAIEIHREPTES
jgi:hypothetical protein